MCLRREEQGSSRTEGLVGQSLDQSWQRWPFQESQKSHMVLQGSRVYLRHIGLAHSQTFSEFLSSKPLALGRSSTGL